MRETRAAPRRGGGRQGSGEGSKGREGERPTSTPPLSTISIIWKTVRTLTSLSYISIFNTLITIPEDDSPFEEDHGYDFCQRLYMGFCKDLHINHYISTFSTLIIISEDDSPFEEDHEYDFCQRLYMGACKDLHITHIAVSSVH